MANVLPPDPFREARTFYRERIVFVGSLISIGCSGIMFLALMPAYAVVNATIPKDSSPEIAPASTSDADRQEIIRAQVLLKELQPIASSTRTTLSSIEAALSARPLGVSVQSIHLSREETGTLILNGTVASREKINEYRSNLTKDARFKSVSVPIGILAGSEDGRFTITLTGDF